MSRKIFRFLKFLPLISVPFIQRKIYNESENANQQIETSIQRLYLSPLDVSLSQFKVFQLDSGQLGKQVAAHLDIALGEISSTKFNDGECNIQVLDYIRGHNVYLIKRFKPKQINDGLIELLIAVNTLKKQGANKVICIIPFFPYSQSTDFHPQQKQSFFTSFGSDILKMLEQGGCDTVITFNSLMAYPKGFVNQCKFININAPDLFIGHLATNKLIDPVLVSTYISTPNVNNLHILKDAFKMVNFDCPISTFNQDQYIGQNVKNKDVILYSNIIRSGNTFVKLSKILRNMGARNIYGCAFHSVGTQKDLDNIAQNSQLEEFITTNSLPHNKVCKSIRSISLSRVIAQTITLFEQEKSLNQYRIDLQKKKMDFVNEMKNINKKQAPPNRIQEVI